MNHIVRIQQKRKADSDKPTRFIVRGHAVAQEKVDRWQKRQKVKIPSDGAGIPMASNGKRNLASREWHAS